MVPSAAPAEPSRVAAGWLVRILQPNPFITAFRTATMNTRTGLVGRRRSGHVKCIVSDSFSYYRPTSGLRADDMAEAVRRGMAKRPRSIPPRFFYDLRGSELFEEICRLPEYYQTRTEAGILSVIRYELARFLHGSFRLVELGSGSSTKTRHVLDALTEFGPGIEYVPIDISDFLEDGAGSLAADYPGLVVTGVVDTYERGLDLVRDMGGPRNLIAFFGSSLGNMSPDESASFLGMVRNSMRPGDLFLVGLDMVKDAGVLEAAYNDSGGVTARFNLNLLTRMNRDLGANFDLRHFAHHSVYNRDEQRIEMHIRSSRDQTVDIPGAGVRVFLKEGDLIHTENSHKYTIQQIRLMADRSGFKIERLWRDAGGKFSLTLMSRAPIGPLPA